MSLIPKLHGKALLKQQKEAVIKIIKGKGRWGNGGDVFSAVNLKRGNSPIRRGATKTFHLVRQFFLSLSSHCLSYNRRERKIPSSYDLQRGKEDDDDSWYQKKDVAGEGR